jgi:glycosyltransferase involved in cell wall biosynthesis
MTAAYNEEANIEKTIEAVLSQTVAPSRWVIVSDGSVDRTDEIVESWAKKCPFIHFLRFTRPPGHSFASKVRALHAGSELFHDVEYDFIANLDADVSVGPKYFEHLMERFAQRPLLGIAGGFVVEDTGGEYRARPQNRTFSVAHAAQIVRRECYQAIGGYTILEYGGEDWYAQVSAQMKGWEVEAFPDLKIFHHRHTGEADNLLRHKFRQGRMDYSFGSLPLFEVLKCAKRVFEKPVFFGAMTRLAGFFWSLTCRERRPASDEFIAFLRREQKERVQSFLRLRKSDQQSLIQLR